MALVVYSVPRTFPTLGKDRDVAGRVQVRDDSSGTAGVRSTAASGVSFSDLAGGLHR